MALFAPHPPAEPELLPIVPLSLKAPVLRPPSQGAAGGIACWPGSPSRNEPAPGGLGSVFLLLFLRPPHDSAPSRHRAKGSRPHLGDPWDVEVGLARSPAMRHEALPVHDHLLPPPPPPSPCPRGPRGACGRDGTAGRQEAALHASPSRGRPSPGPRPRLMAPCAAPRPGRARAGSDADLGGRVSRPDPRWAGRMGTRVSGRGHRGSSWRQLEAGTPHGLPLPSLAFWSTKWAG